MEASFHGLRDVFANSSYIAESMMGSFTGGTAFKTVGGLRAPSYQHLSQDPYEIGL